jgi:hypothetical protein
MDTQHSYVKYESLPEWGVIDKAISDLIDNNDLVEQTARYCIIGYILRSLGERGLLKSQSKGA